jgi:acetylornithine deacetylase
MAGSSASAIRSNRLYDLFKEMVDIYSPSGKEEEITEFLYDYLLGRLKGTACTIQLQPVDEARSNILVTSPGSAELPIDFALESPTNKTHFTTLLLGHIDTVPAFDIDNYQLEKAEGLLYGLGTADMKSGCAAMIEAFCEVAEAHHLPAGLMMALVVGEEETGDGTRALLEMCHFEGAVVAEPTGLFPCLEHFGYVEMLLNTYGYRRHAAMSSRGTNAIHSMLHCLLGIEETIEHNEPDTILNIRDLHSSESGFAVPDRCSAGVDFHLPPSLETEAYADALRERIQERLWEGQCTKFEIEFPTLDNGFSSDADGKLAQTLRAVYEKSGRPWQLIPFKSHSDANLLFAAGCQTIILGPGELAQAHTRDESVEFDQVVAAAEIFAALLYALHQTQHDTL